MINELRNGLQPFLNCSREYSEVIEWSRFRIHFCLGEDPVPGSSRANPCDPGHRSRAHDNDLQVIDGRVVCKYGIHVDILPCEDAGHHAAAGHLSSDTVHQAVERSARERGRGPAMLSNRGIRDSLLETGCVGVH